MSAWLIALTGLIYVAVAVDQVRQGNVALAIGYSGYAWANVGFYMLAK